MLAVKTEDEFNALMENLVSTGKVSKETLQNFMDAMDTVNEKSEAVTASFGKAKTAFTTGMQDKTTPRQYISINIDNEGVVSGTLYHNYSSAFASIPIDAISKMQVKSENGRLIFYDPDGEKADIDLGIATLEKVENTNSGNPTGEFFITGMSLSVGYTVENFNEYGAFKWLLSGSSLDKVFLDAGN